MDAEPAINSADDLALHWLDGSATPEQTEAFLTALTTSETHAAEFAQFARLEHALKRHLRAEAKATLEFAALECAMADEVFPIATPEIVLVQKRPGPSKALILAVVAMTALLVALLIPHWQPPPPKLAEPAITVMPAASSPPIATTPARFPSDTALLVRPRHDPSAPFVSLTQGVKGTPPSRPLAECLRDFYLPDVTLDQVSFVQAVQWLTAQARTLNYLKRPELESLQIDVPAQARQRIVTLITGPISFGHAITIISRLAQCEISINDAGITITDHGTGTTAATVQTLHATAPHAPPPGKDEITADLVSLGLKLSAVGLTINPQTGIASVMLTADQAAALHQLQAARLQVNQLPPLTLVPLALPTGLDADASAEALRQQSLAAAKNPPRLLVPRQTARPSVTPQSHPAGLRLVTFPIGELNALSLDPAIAR